MILQIYINDDKKLQHLFIVFKKSKKSNNNYFSTKNKSGFIITLRFCNYSFQLCYNFCVSCIQFRITKIKEENND